MLRFTTYKGLVEWEKQCSGLGLTYFDLITDGGWSAIIFVFMIDLYS